MKAIDCHVHPATAEAIASGGRFREFAAKRFGVSLEPVSIEQTAAKYRDLDMMAVLLAIDAETATGNPRVPNELIAQAQTDHSDVFIGFGSVDPLKGDQAVVEAERAIRELGLRGLKFQPIQQGFRMNDERFDPLWAKCQELAVPILVHLGTTGLGSGMPGGGGLRLDYARPIPYLDDIAARFPDLTIIGAHPAWPWHDELLAVCVHKANVWMDLSGWSPKYFPPSVVRYINSMLQDKTLFGSDYPLLQPERWLQDFEALDIKHEVRDKILLRNAQRLFGLETSAG
jgi:predicted TIM-barrel fold metal-dependent hydrolase